jgi:uncharacterized protein (DUF302 family)
MSDLASDTSLVELKSRYDFTETMARLIDVIKGAGMTLFTCIDHAETAASVGIAMPRTSVLIYGNPKVGTPLMLACPQLSLDLPLRVLIREENESTWIAFHSSLSVIRAVGLPDEQAESLKKADALLATTVY